MKWTIIVLAFVFIIAYWLMTERRRQLRLKADRKDLTADEFTEFFESNGIPKSFTTVIYGYLQGLLAVKGVPITPEDDLQEMLGIGSSSGVLLDDAVEDALLLVKVNFPFKQHMEIFAQENGWSGKVHDLVKLLFFLKCKSEEMGVNQTA